MIQPPGHYRQYRNVIEAVTTYHHHGLLFSVTEWSLHAELMNRINFQRKRCRVKEICRLAIALLKFPSSTFPDYRASRPVNCELRAWIESAEAEPHLEGITPL